MRSKSKSRATHCCVVRSFFALPYGGIGGAPRCHYGGRPPGRGAKSERAAKMAHRGASGRIGAHPPCAEQGVGNASRRSERFNAQRASTSWISVVKVALASPKSIFVFS